MTQGRKSQRYLSGRSKIIGFSGLSTDRHLYVEPGQVEPNLGFPGEKSLPVSSTYYKLITVDNGSTFDRYWQEDLPATLVNGVSIFDEGTLVGTANTVSKIDFVGAAVTATASGTISTITVTPVSISTEAPPSARHGDLWWDSDEGELNVYYQDINSAQWVLANSGIGTTTGSGGGGGGSGGANVTVSSNPPTSPTPSNGDLWWDSDIGELYIYYTDGDSNQWVETSGGSETVTISDNPPSSPNDGDLWWESDTGSLKIYYNDGDSQQWVDSNAGVLSSLASFTAWSTNSTGIHTTANVGIGTTTADAALTVDGNARITGITTLGNTIVGSATTELIVQGDARVTGILSVGTGTLVITDTGINATGIITATGFKIGTGVTVSEVGNFDIIGIVTATKFVGDGSGLTNLSGGGGAGAQGAQGSQGAAGSNGSNGATGAQGAQGVAGTAASQGAQGATGSTGSTGAQGAQGHQGVAGATASQGAQGATGATGAQGAQGHQGATGTGAQGATGATGAQGATGSGGATGAQGNTGSTGAQGAQGHQGNTGSTGAQGDAGSRSYTVTNSGASAYVIDGSNNPTLNLLRGFTYTFNINASGHPFYIKTAQTTGTGNQYTSGVTGNGTQSGTLTFAVPYNAPSTLYYICQYHSAMKGTISISDVGPTGAQGATGATGAQGATGSTGAQGATGSTGAQGAQGHQGATGSGGATGAQGATGSTGAQGATGSTGAQGAQGHQGATGSGGSTGAQGAQGHQGNTGSTGAQGAQGHQGHQGNTGGGGSTGAQGATGSTGAQGATGSGGGTGAQGSAGAQGASGSGGGTGAQGAQGHQGSTGSTGAQGGTSTYAVPAGGIIIWSGTVSNIPSGWVLCNGSNNTPDLRNKFVIGAHSDSGGSAKTTVSGSATQSGGSKDAILVEHTHNLQNHVHGINLTTDNPGNHTHGVPKGQGGSQASIANYVPSPRVEYTQSPFNTTGGGSHTHTVSGNTGTPATNTTDTLGESATNKNLPPYYALCYIMKT